MRKKSLNSGLVPRTSTNQRALKWRNVYENEIPETIAQKV